MLKSAFLVVGTGGNGGFDKSSLQNGRKWVGREKCSCQQVYRCFF